MTMEEPDRSFFLALLDKIYPGPREAVERAWGNPEHHQSVAQTGRQFRGGVPGFRARRSRG
jgi:hypothetical protein